LKLDVLEDPPQSDQGSVADRGQDTFLHDLSSSQPSVDREIEKFFSLPIP
jgi:hypothetical protein